MKQLLSIFIAALLLFTMPITAHAQDIVSPDDLDDPARTQNEYITSAYRDNYYLDVVELGIMESGESIFNNLSNAIFSINKMVVYITVVLFYYSMSLDIGGLLGTQVNTIQSGLMNAIFYSLFFLALAASLFHVVKQLYKRNMQGIAGEILKVLLLLVISIGVTGYSGAFLSYVNTITKSVSIAALGELSGSPVSSNGSVNQDNLNSYSAAAAGILWDNMLHKCWLSLEFGTYQPTEAEVKSILSEPIGSDARQKVVEDLNKSAGIFGKEVGGQRLGIVLMLLILTLAKCLIFMIIFAIQIGFQALTIIYLLLCPLILILAMLPQLGGFELVTKWLKKVLETQLSILIMSFIVGMVVKLDAVLFSMADTLGWVIVLVLQTLIYAVIILFRSQILSIVSGLSHAAANPIQTARRMEGYASADMEQMTEHMNAYAYSINLPQTASAYGRSLRRGFKKTGRFFKGMGAGIVNNYADAIARREERNNSSEAEDDAQNDSQAPAEQNSAPPRPALQRPGHSDRRPSAPQPFRAAMDVPQYQSAQTQPSERDSVRGQAFDKNEQYEYSKAKDSKPLSAVNSPADDAQQLRPLHRPGYLQWDPSRIKSNEDESNLRPEALESTPRPASPTPAAQQAITGENGAIQQNRPVSSNSKKPQAGKKSTQPEKSLHDRWQENSSPNKRGAEAQKHRTAAPNIPAEVTAMEEPFIDAPQTRPKTVAPKKPVSKTIAESKQVSPAYEIEQYHKQKEKNSRPAAGTKIASREEEFAWNR